MVPCKYFVDSKWLQYTSMTLMQEIISNPTRTVSGHYQDFNLSVTKKIATMEPYNIVAPKCSRYKYLESKI